MSLYFPGQSFATSVCTLVFAPINPFTENGVATQQTTQIHSPATHIVYTVLFGQLRTKVSLALQHQQANTSRMQRH